jgi:ribosome maturation factor RimP
VTRFSRESMWLAFPARSFYIAAIPDNRNAVVWRSQDRRGEEVLPFEPKRLQRKSHTILSAVSQLEPLIEPAVEAAGFRLVRLRLVGGTRKTLQIMAERADGTMNVEDCAALSRALSAFLEREDPIEGEYVLEISSPGIDRPLTRLPDFARWSGHEAKIELKASGTDGRKRFKGRLLGLDGTDIVLEVDGARFAFAHPNIAEAKLVLTDKLIEEDLKSRKHARGQEN